VCVCVCRVCVCVCCVDFYTSKAPQHANRTFVVPAHGSRAAAWCVALELAASSSRAVRYYNNIYIDRRRSKTVG